MRRLLRGFSAGGRLRGSPIDGLKARDRPNIPRTRTLRRTFALSRVLLFLTITPFLDDTVASWNCGIAWVFSAATAAMVATGDMHSVPRPASDTFGVAPETLPLGCAVECCTILLLPLRSGGLFRARPLEHAHFGLGRPLGSEALPLSRPPLVVFMSAPQKHVWGRGCWGALRRILSRHADETRLRRSPGPETPVRNDRGVALKRSCAEKSLNAFFV